MTIHDKLKMKLREIDHMIKILKEAGTVHDHWVAKRSGLMIAIHAHEMHEMKTKERINQLRYS